MKTIPQDVSDFARAALSLNQDFEQLSSLGEQLEQLDIETEFGLNQSKKLLSHYGECGERISGSDRDAWATHLPEMEAGMARLMDEAKKIKIEARESKMKTLEKDADAFAQMLQSLTTRLQNAAKTSLPM